MNRCPAPPTIAANSRSGRCIYLERRFSSELEVDFSVSESSGLAVAFRCRSDKCRYRLVVSRLE
jgi:hypothetical protein